MKVLNTSTATGGILALFKRKLGARKGPNIKADALALSIAPFLLPLVKVAGEPSIQLFGAQAFEYGGRNFATDVTWVWPDGAIDGIVVSFLVEEHGKGIQFILFDPQVGTVYENFALARMAGVASGLSISHFVMRTLSYCAGIAATRSFAVP